MADLSDFLYAVDQANPLSSNFIGYPQWLGDNFPSFQRHPTPWMSGEASYYDNSSIDPRWGGITKGGQKFDENKMTAAVSPSMWKKLKGKKARVVANGREVIVDINDTGGFDKYNRVMDLSKGAFKKLFGSTKQGTGNVTVYPWER